MDVNIRYSSIYNVVTYEQSSKAKNYQMGLNHNWDLVSSKYPNWGLFPQQHSTKSDMYGDPEEGLSVEPLTRGVAPRNMTKRSKL